MHTAGYAGIPAANAAMAIAKQVLAEEERIDRVPRSTDEPGR